jgi:hypothetical protein
MISILFFLLAIFFYACLSVLKFRNDVSIFSRWPKFFGQDSWRNKYKKHKTLDHLIAAPEFSWYYSTFNLFYKERFPGSATIFSWLTDGYHFIQMLFSFSVVVSIVTFKANIDSWSELFWWILIMKLLWITIHEYLFSTVLIKKK